MTYLIPVKKLSVMFPGHELVAVAVNDLGGKLHLAIGYNPPVTLPEGLGETTEEAFADFFKKVEQ